MIDQLLIDLGAVVRSPVDADGPALIFVNDGFVLPPFGVELVPTEDAELPLLAAPGPYMLGGRAEGWVTQRHPGSEAPTRLYRLMTGTRVHMIAPDGRSITTVTG